MDWRVGRDLIHRACFCTLCLDGRAWGFVPRELVIGRAMFVYWSYDETKPFNSPLDFFTNTRWSRTGTMVK